MRTIFFFVLLAVAILASPSASASLPGLTVKDNRIVAVDSGEPLHLVGLNGPSAVYACLGGYSVWDKAVPTQQVIGEMKRWGAKIVRLGVNEDCWLGINGVHPQVSGEIYRKKIFEYTQLLIANGLYAIVELHWTAPGSQVSRSQMSMPDLDHTPHVWALAAQMWRSHPQVIFDLFNEPFPMHNAARNTQAWRCWRDGGAQCQDIQGWQAVGMQKLVDTVRSVSHTNVLMLGGCNYANDLSMWLEFMPEDPAKMLVASIHNYKGNICSNPLCWDSIIKNVSKTVPVIAGEIGETDCESTFILPFAKWADENAIGYLAWTYDDYADCRRGPSLVTNATFGECTVSYGCDYKKHLLSLK